VSKKIKGSLYYAHLLIKIFYDKERHVDTMDTSTTSKLYEYNNSNSLLEEKNCIKGSSGYFASHITLKVTRIRHEPTHRCGKEININDKLDEFYKEISKCKTII
jgi:hypothetical protein